MAITPSIAQVAHTPQRESDRYLPESPRWISLEGRPAMAWVNIQSGADSNHGHVHIGFLDNGERRRFSLPARPGFLLPSEVPDTVIIGLEKAVGMLNLKRGNWIPLARIPDDRPRTIINDGQIVPGGRAILFGTKDVRFEDPIGHLYLMTFPDQQVVAVADGMICSNGKVIRPLGDDAIVFDIDTPRKLIERYFLDLGKRQLTRDGIALDFRKEEAFPDGMVDCGDGSIIVAFYNPFRGGDGFARRYRVNSRERVEEWTIPGSPRVTCPMLMKHDGRVKVVFTTAVEGMPDAMRRLSPNAGALFIANTALSDCPEPEVVHLS
jgi:sugar lactone lactonase YvrE